MICLLYFYVTDSLWDWVIRETVHVNKFMSDWRSYTVVSNIFATELKKKSGKHHFWSSKNQKYNVWCKLISRKKKTCPPGQISYQQTQYTNNVTTWNLKNDYKKIKDAWMILIITTRNLLVIYVLRVVRFNDLQNDDNIKTDRYLDRKNSHNS